MITAVCDMQGAWSANASPAPLHRALPGPRHPLLHLPPRHRHGTDHPGRVPGHELGVRLRRLPRRPDWSTAPGHPLAGTHRPRPLRRLATKRPTTSVPVAPRRILQPPGRAPRRSRLSRPRWPPNSSSTSFAQSFEQAHARATPTSHPIGWFNEDYQLLQATRPNRSTAASATR